MFIDNGRDAHCVYKRKHTCWRCNEDDALVQLFLLTAACSYSGRLNLDFLDKCCLLSENSPDCVCCSGLDDVTDYDANLLSDHQWPCGKHKRVLIFASYMVRKNVLMFHTPHIDDRNVLNSTTNMYLNMVFDDDVRQRGLYDRCF